MSLIFSFMLRSIVLTLCLMGTRSGLDASSENDINRFSSGLKFKFLHNFVPITEKWRHTFLINTPLPWLTGTHRDFGVLHEGTHLQWFDDCLLGNDIHLHSPTNQSEMPKMETDISAHCIYYVTYIRKMLQVVKLNHQLVLEKADLIKNLLPKDLSHAFQSRKRGWFDFGGWVLGSVFGLSTSRDLAKVSNQLRYIGQFVLHQNRVFKHSMGVMGSYSKALNNRIDNLVQTVRNSSLNTIHIMESWTTAQEDRTKFFLAFLAKVTEHQSSINGLLFHLSLFQEAVQQLTTGVLPSFLIPPAVLEEVMTEISIRAKQAQGSLRLISNTPLSYYKRSTFTYAVLDQHLAITVEFPLTNFDTSFDVYQLEYYPLLVPGQNSTMTLKYQNEAVAFQKNQENYFFLDLAEVIEIQITGGLQKAFKSVRIMNPSVCIVGLFLDDKASIQKYCEYTISINNIAPTLLWLYGSTFLFSGHETYRLQCGGGVTQLQPDCGTQCIITTSPECQVVTSTEKSVMLLSNSSKLPVFHRFVINFSYLNNFFTAENLRVIGGNDLMEMPPKFHLPDLKVFENPIRHMVAEDRRLEVDMDNVVDSIKNKSTLIHSLGDGIFYNSLDNSQLFGDSLEYIVLSLIIMLILLFIHSVYCTLRLRTVALTLAVLQKNLIPRTEALDFLQNPLELTFTINPQKK